jgi:hypothetical protein
MPWTSLGAITLSDDWQFFPQAALGYETFRLIHTTTVDPFNRCWLTRWFPAPGDGGQYAPWRKLYPSHEPVVIYLPIPADYLEQGIVVFSLQAKLKLPYYPVPWLLEIQALI